MTLLLASVLYLVHGSLANRRNVHEGASPVHSEEMHEAPGDNIFLYLHIPQFPHTPDPE